jgi:hypothetical protein
MIRWSKPVQSGGEAGGGIPKPWYLSRIEKKEVPR